MAGQRSPAQARTKLIALLQSTLPAALDVVDAQFSDNITLENIDNSAYYEAHLPTYDQPRNLVLASRDTDKSLDEMNSTFASHFFDLDLIFQSQMEGTDDYRPQEELVIRIERTEQAVHAILDTDAGKRIIVGGVPHCNRLYWLSTAWPVLRGIDDPDAIYQVFATMDVEVRISVSS